LQSGGLRRHAKPAAKPAAVHNNTDLATEGILALGARAWGSEVSLSRPRRTL
jgi:hypothetical protein